MGNIIFLFLFIFSYVRNLAQEKLNLILFFLFIMLLVYSTSTLNLQYIFFLYMSSDANSLLVMFKSNSMIYIMFIIHLFLFFLQDVSADDRRKKKREGGAKTHAHIAHECDSRLFHVFFSNGGRDTQNFCRLKRRERKKKEYNTDIDIQQKRVQVCIQ